MVKVHIQYKGKEREIALPCEKFISSETKQEVAGFRLSNLIEKSSSRSNLVSKLKGKTSTLLLHEESTSQIFIPIEAFMSVLYIHLPRTYLVLDDIMTIAEKLKKDFRQLAENFSVLENQFEKFKDEVFVNIIQIKEFITKTNSKSDSDLATLHESISSILNKEKRTKGCKRRDRNPEGKDIYYRKANEIGTWTFNNEYSML